MATTVESCNIEKLLMVAELDCAHLQLKSLWCASLFLRYIRDARGIERLCAPLHRVARNAGSTSNC
jgi:hypothetical protein